MLDSHSATQLWRGHFGLRDFKDQFIVNLQQHPCRAFFAPQTGVNLDHGQFDQIRRRALNHCIDGGSFGKVPFAIGPPARVPITPTTTTPHSSKTPPATTSKRSTATAPGRKAALITSASASTIGSCSDAYQVGSTKVVPDEHQQPAMSVKQFWSPGWLHSRDSVPT